MCLVAVLSVVYAATFVFDPARSDPLYSWAAADALERADRVDVTGSRAAVTLRRIAGRWVAGDEGYPVKQGRVSDLFAALSRRARYPVVSRSAAALERLGLAPGRASRVTVRGGAGLPLLDLLVGFGDAAGRDVYLRRAAETEARSGEDVFSLYTESVPEDWYDLRLFPGVTTGMVQRVRVGESVYTRRGGGWDVEGVEGWLRGLLGASAAGFAEEAAGERFELAVELELGDGRVVTLSAPAGGDRGMVTGTGWVYALEPGWVERVVSGRPATSSGRGTPGISPGRF